LIYLIFYFIVTYTTGMPQLKLTETHLVIHVKFPLPLSDFNWNWNVSTYFSTSPPYQMSFRSSAVSRCYMQTDSDKRCIFVVFLCGNTSRPTAKGLIHMI